MKNYVNDCNDIQKRLEKYQTTIDIINREEELFEWDQTKYPALEDVTNNLTPYAALVTLTY